MKYTLINWAITGKFDVYAAPEATKKYLTGLRLEDSKEVITSSIKKIEGRNIITSSGNVYYLQGEPSEEYLNWMLDNDFVYDVDNPIKVRG